MAFEYDDDCKKFDKDWKTDLIRLGKDFRLSMSDIERIISEIEKENIVHICKDVSDDYKSEDDDIIRYERGRKKIIALLNY